MTDNYDYIPTYDEDGDMRHYATSEPDLRGGQLDSPTLGTDPSNRPAISNNDETLYVDPVNGSDTNPGTQEHPLATVQEAVERVPIVLRHQFTIDLATVPDLPVTYDEDVLVGTIIGTGQAGQEGGAPEAGPVNHLRIKGDTSTPSNVEVGSICFANVNGVVTGNLLGATILRDHPYDDENFGFASYGTGEVRAYEVHFGPNVTNGIIAYGGDMKVSLVDLGASDLNIGIKAKRHASIVSRDVTGTTTGTTFMAAANSKVVSRQSNSASGSPTHDTVKGGVVYDEGADAWYGLGGVGESFDLNGNNLLGISTVRGDGTGMMFRMDEDQTFKVMHYDSNASDFVNIVSANAGKEDFRVHSPGKGINVTTPDGTAQYRIRVDNSGNVVTDQL